MRVNRETLTRRTRPLLLRNRSICRDTAALLCRGLQGGGRTAAFAFLLKQLILTLNIISSKHTSILKNKSPLHPPILYQLT